MKKKIPLFISTLTLLTSSLAPAATMATKYGMTDYGSGPWGFEEMMSAKEEAENIVNTICPYEIFSSLCFNQYTVDMAPEDPIYYRLLAFGEAELHILSLDLDVINEKNKIEYYFDHENFYEEYNYREIIVIYDSDWNIIQKYFKKFPHTISDLYIYQTEKDVTIDPMSDNFIEYIKSPKIKVLYSAEKAENEDSLLSVDKRDTLEIDPISFDSKYSNFLGVSFMDESGIRHGYNIDMSQCHEGGDLCRLQFSSPSPMPLLVNKPTYDEGYTDGYNIGYQEGHISGEETGFDRGMNEGYGSGYDDGYNDGYNLGHLEGEDHGIEIGYNDGLIAGENQGYDQGYRIGEEIGYNWGFNEGLMIGEDYGYNNGYGNGLNDGYWDGYEAGYNAGASESYYEGFRNGITAGYEDGYLDGRNLGYESGYAEGLTTGLLEKDNVENRDEDNGDKNQSLTENVPNGSTSSEPNINTESDNTLDNASLDTITLAIDVANDNALTLSTNDIQSPLVNNSSIRKKSALRAPETGTTTYDENRSTEFPWWIGVIFIIGFITLITFFGPRVHKKQKLFKKSTKKYKKLLTN